MRRSLLHVICLLIVFAASNSFAVFTVDIDVDETNNTTTIKFVQDAPKTMPEGFGGVIEIEYSSAPLPTYLDGTPTSGADSEKGQINWAWLTNTYDLDSVPDYVKVDKVADLMYGTPGVGTTDYNYTFALVFPTAENFAITYSATWDMVDIPETTIQTQDPGTDPAPEIDCVTEYDFSDITVGESMPYALQISNSGQANLNIPASSVAIAGSSDFSIIAIPDTDPSGNIVIAPGQDALIQIVYQPSAAGLVTAVLTFDSDDADEPSVTVNLTGKGVVDEVPVEQLILDTIDYYKAAISGDNPKIIGKGPNSKAAANREKALGNMLEAVGKLIEVGEDEIAINQLQDIAKKTDGENRPPDFVEDGSEEGSVAELNRQINEIIAFLEVY